MAAACVAVSLSNIARMVALNGIQDAVLDASLDAHRLETMTLPVTWRNALVGYQCANEFRDSVLDAREWPQHATA